MTPGRRAVLATALGAAAAAAGAYRFLARGGGALRIGVPLPLSGEMGDEGRNLLQATQMAADEISANGPGVPGERLHVVIVPMDDHGDDAAAPQAALALVARGVTAVVGHLTSGTAIAAAPVYARAGIPELSAVTHPRFTQLGLSTTFRLVANDDMQARALGRYAATEFRGEGFVVVDDGSLYGKGLADDAAVELQSAGQKVLLRRSYDPRAAAFDEVLDAVARDHAGVVITTMELPQARLLMQQLIAAGRAGVVVMGGDSLRAGPVPPEAARLRRFLATTPVTDVLEFGAAGQAFVDRYHARFHQAPAETAHYLYDAVYLLAQAASSQHSTDGAVLARALRRIDPAVPVTGYLRFRDDGELRYGAISLYDGVDGHWRLVARASDW